MQKINQKYINNFVKKALLEDLSPKGDVTTNLLNSKNKIIKAKIIAKQNGIISGLDFCKTAFKLIGKETVFKQKIKDGHTLIIFPEGTRKLPGSKPDYKSGVAGIYEKINTLQFKYTY